VSRGQLRVLVGVAFLTVIAPVAARAQAVSGFAVDRFEPAGADSAWMTAESLAFDSHLKPFAALVTDWAWRPLVVYDAGGHAVARLVDNQLLAHADVAMFMWNRARFDLNLPVLMVNSGDGTLLGTTRYAPPDGAAIGDIRLGADVVVYRRPDRLFTGAVGVQLFLPTGSTQAFSSDGGVRVWPRLQVAGERRAFAWAGRFGVQFRPSDSCHCNLAPGTEVDGALAGGWRPRPEWLVGPEVIWSHAVGSGASVLRSGTPLEVLVGGHYAATPTWTFNLGLGHGLTNGAGTPAFRMIVGAQYAFRELVHRPNSDQGAQVAP
jgi:OmpA-OmpF porin, OOP family